jgi:hypothetical protein
MDPLKLIFAFEIFIFIFLILSPSPSPNILVLPLHSRQLRRIDQLKWNVGSVE